MKNLKQTLINVAFPIISAIVVAGLAYAVWVEPGTNPPDENVDAPINVGPFLQSKEGALGIWGLFKTYTRTILATDDNGNASENVGIGTNNPNSPAPNGAAAGNLDANDAYIRSISQWVSQSGGLYQISCSVDVGAYFCCRARTDTGETKCKATSRYDNWVDMGQNPSWAVPAGRVGLYRLTCDVGSYAYLCCLGNADEGTTQCRMTTNGSTWYSTELFW